MNKEVVGKNSMHTGLERQLTLSHLAVTTLSAGILALLILGGYVIYLRTDWSARWAGETAAFFAEELSFLHEEQEMDFLDPFLSQAFVDGLVPAVDVVDDTLAPILPLDDQIDDQLDDQFDGFDDTLYAEWLLVLASDGTVVAGNHESRYPPGFSLATEPPPGFQVAVLQNAHFGDMYYKRAGELYGGQAPILDTNGQTIGWVYYQTSDILKLV